MNRRIGMLITLCKQHIGRLLERMLAEYGIDEFSGPQGRILHVLWNRDAVSIQTLACGTGLTNATLTGMLDRMEHKELIQRRPAPGDRRKTLIVLTGKARALEREYQEVSRRMNDLTYQGFTGEEAERLEHDLERVLENLRRAEAQWNNSSHDNWNHHNKRRWNMDRTELAQTVRNMIAAPSCCKELKAAGEKYLRAMGSGEEKAAGAELLQEIREDIATIDHVIEFFESSRAADIFGAEKAAAMAAHAHEVKAAGGKWCDCPACAAGLKILENASLLA